MVHPWTGQDPMLLAVFCCTPCRSSRPSGQVAHAIGQWLCLCPPRASFPHTPERGPAACLSDSKWRARCHSAVGCVYAAVRSPAACRCVTHDARHGNKKIKSMIGGLTHDTPSALVCITDRQVSRTTVQQGPAQKLSTQQRLFFTGQSMSVLYTRGVRQPLR